MLVYADDSEYYYNKSVGKQLSTQLKYMSVKCAAQKIKTLDFASVMCFSLARP